ncbi:MAG: PAS domain-containing protein, partial [Spirochaeta sp.]|nr:PAS domain-containing protein [Spirochaeta sp.]
DEVYRIFGCEPQEFAATYEAFLGFVHPDDRAAVDDAYSRPAVNGGTSRVLSGHGRGTDGVILAPLPCNAQ